MRRALPGPGAKAGLHRPRQGEMGDPRPEAAEQKRLPGQGGKAGRRHRPMEAAQRRLPEQGAKAGLRQERLQVVGDQGDRAVQGEEGVRP